MIRRDALREYVRGSLWVLPTLCALAALALGTALSRVDVGPSSPLAFQGTADDARSILIGITGTMVTVIALLLGLAVVALQLSSTQFSPRLLRNFLRDRPNQLVLGAFVGTFAYSAAGLMTVGVSGGERSAEFPRFAVSVAVVLLFVSLGLLVFFADHLAHSLQIDAIMRVVERNTMPVIRSSLFVVEQPLPPVPERSAPIPARRSGYVQAVDVQQLLAVAVQRRLTVRLQPIVGEHVVAGTVLGWVWSEEGGVVDQPAARAVAEVVYDAVRLGFERTLEQDPGFGFRQLVDPACKALSPAVNDPYTAVQAIEHLSVLFCTLAAGPVGDHIARDAQGVARVVIPARRFGEHLALGLGLIRRYGAAEPTVMQALLRLLGSCALLSIDDPDRWAAIERQAELIVTAAEREVAEPADLAVVHAEAAKLRRTLAARRAGHAGLAGAGDVADAVGRADAARGTTPPA
ncbi:MAG TPA: DUF2254 domain-containing protein [Pseudonocardiaceae bacterium]|jgi:uncharacterized membrane protein